MGRLLYLGIFLGEIKLCRLVFFGVNFLFRYLNLVLGIWFTVIGGSLFRNLG